MSNTVDTKTVEMRFDNSNFEKNARQSMSTLEKLKRALKLDGASAGLAEVEKASKKLDFRDLNKNIDGVGQKFNALQIIATGALLKIGSSAAEAGMKLAKSMSIDQVMSGWNKYASKTEAVQTIMANLKDTNNQFIDDTSKMAYTTYYLERLMWFSDETSYSFSEMTNNLGKFTAVGQGLKESTTAIQGIATWAAMAGQRSQGAARAMYNISQALGAGAMTTIDWKSIENANMATAQFKELAISIGEKQGRIKKGEVTIENFRESLSKRWFDKKVMMEVFETYGDAADKIQAYTKRTGKTAQEVINQIKHGDDELAKEVGISADSVGFKALVAAQEAKTFGEVVDATADAVSTKWLKIFENIFGDYLQAKELWSDFAERMYDIFAAPLDTVIDIMSIWNNGLFEGGPKDDLQDMFQMRELDDLANETEYVSQAAADLAVSTNSAKFRIEELADGSKYLVQRLKGVDGKYTETAKKIYTTDDKLVSGREMLADSFKNIFDTIFNDVYDKNGELESMSLFGALKRGFLEVIFGSSETRDVVASASKKIWDMTKSFKDLTEKMRPSAETSEKIKNIFKGLFTIFKIGFKVVKAIIKPFKDLISGIFAKKEGKKGLLDMADSMSVWIQKLDEFLDKNQVFETIANGVSAGIKGIKSALDSLSVALTGKTVGELIDDLKKKINDFFGDHDFQGKLKTVEDFFTGLQNDINIVNSENLPEQLTPTQKFFLKLKEIFDGFVSFLTFISPAFESVKTFFSDIFNPAGEALTDNKVEKGLDDSGSALDNFLNSFKGFFEFFEKVSPSLSKIVTSIVSFIANIAEALAKWSEGKSPDEILDKIIKGGFIGTLIVFINSLSSLLGAGGKIGKSIAGDFKAIKKVLKGYARELNADALLTFALAVGVFAGSMWVLAQIPSDKLAPAGWALLQIAAALAAFCLIRDKLKKTGEAIESTSKKADIFEGIKGILTSVVGESIFANDKTAKFVKIALGVLLAAIAAKKLVEAVGNVADVVKKLNGVSRYEWEKGGKTIAQIVVLFGVFALLSGFSNTATSALFAALGAYVLISVIGKLIDLLADLGGDTAKMDKVEAAANRFEGVFDTVKDMATTAIKIIAAIGFAQILIAAFSTGKNTDTRGMAKVLKEFGKNFTRIAWAMVAVALAFSLMALTTKNLSANDFNAISGFFIAFYSIVGIIQGLIIGLTSYSKQNKNTAAIMEQFGKNYTRIALALVLVSVAFAIMSMLKFGDNGKATFGQITATFLLFVGLATAMIAIASKNATLKKSDRFIANLKVMLKLFLAISVAFVIIAGAIYLIAKSDIGKSEFDSVLALFAGIGVIALAIMLIASKNSTTSKTNNIIKSVEAIAGLFIAVAASLVIVSAAFAIMAALKLTPKEMWNITAIFGAFVGVVIVLALMANRMSSKSKSLKAFKPIANLFLSVAGSLVLVSVAFAIMAGLKLKPKEMWEIAAVFGAFAGIVVLIAALGVLIGRISKSGSIESIAGMSGIMLSAAVSIAIVAAGFALLASSASVDEIKACKDIIIWFGIISAVLALVGGLVLDGHDSILGVLGMMGILLATAISIGIVSLAFAVLAKNMKPEDMDQAIKVIKWFGIIVGGLALLGGLVGGLGGPMAIGGMLAIAGIILAIGAACLIAGVGIGVAVVAFALFVDALSDLVTAIGDKGPEFEKNVNGVLKAALNAVIDNAPLFVEAGGSIISALAVGVGKAIKSAGTWIANKLSTFWDKLVASLHRETDEKGFPVDVEPTFTTDDDAYDEYGENYQKELAELSKRVNADSPTITTNSDNNSAKAGAEAGASAVEKFTNKYEKIVGKAMENYDTSKITNGVAGLSDMLGIESIDITSLSTMLTDAIGQLDITSMWKDSLPGFTTTENGSIDYASILGITGIDTSSYETMLTEAYGQIDLSTIMGGKITELTSGIESSTAAVQPSMNTLSSSIETSITSLDSKKWGEDICTNLADGLRAKEDLVKKAADHLAEVIHDILGFSEPKKGPLSDFHTYAPDMIKLWCRGIYDNIGLIKDSTNDVAESVYDGFSYALDYVSGLIDNGMSDGLTIRPIMDLSEIQNGVNSIDRMMSGANGYAISGTTRLAASAAYGMSSNTMTSPTQGISQTDVGPTTNNFYITNNDPDAVAKKVSKIIGQQTRRQKAVWAYNS